MSLAPPRSHAQLGQNCIKQGVASHWILTSGSRVPPHPYYMSKQSPSPEEMIFLLGTQPNSPRWWLLCSEDSNTQQGVWACMGCSTYLEVQRQLSGVISFPLPCEIWVGIQIIRPGSKHLYALHRPTSPTSRVLLKKCFRLCVQVCYLYVYLHTTGVQYPCRPEKGTGSLGTIACELLCGCSESSARVTSVSNR